MKRIVVLTITLMLLATVGFAEQPAASDEKARFGGHLVVATKGAPPHLDSDHSTI